MGNLRQSMTDEEWSEFEAETMNSSPKKKSLSEEINRIRNKYRIHALLNGTKYCSVPDSVLLNLEILAKEYELIIDRK
jgi:predicted DNA-binding protein (UPF0278 family)